MATEGTKKRKLLFKAKRYGWGWTPATWEGWLVMLVYLAILVKIFLRIESGSPSLSDTLIVFDLPFLVVTAVLIIICYLTGEKPRWRWGGKD